MQTQNRTFPQHKDRFPATSPLRLPACGELVLRLQCNSRGLSLLLALMFQWPRLNSTSLQLCGAAKTEWASICVLSGQTEGRGVGYKFSDS